MPPPPRGTHHHRTLHALGAAVVAGHHPVGSSLPPEPQLCEAFGVSRTVVREAVKSLAAKGLVSTAPKVGTRVRPQDDWNWFDADVVSWHQQTAALQEDPLSTQAAFMADVQEMRLLVEPAAVRLAAERASDTDIAELEAAYAAMHAAAFGQGDYIAADLRFHQILLRASHNRLMVQMSRALAALLKRSFELSTTHSGMAQASLPLHRAVLDAVIRRRPQSAERASKALIEDANMQVQAALCRQGPRATRKR